MFSITIKVETNDIKMGIGEMLHRLFKECDWYINNNVILNVDEDCINSHFDVKDASELMLDIGLMTNSLNKMLEPQ